LSRIISLQSANGSFKWSPIVEEASQKTLKQLKKLLNCNEDSVAITLFIVVFLEKNHAGEKDLWELVADKANHFLAKQLGQKKFQEMATLANEKL